MSRRLTAYGIAAAVFALDRITKMLIQTRMAPLDAATVIPGFFDIVHTQNRGMVFGLLGEGEVEWRAFFLIGLTALALALVSAVLWQTSSRGMAASRLSRLGLALVLGGALGNLYDRLFNGAVTDFLDFHLAGYHWPAFNLGDSGITVGAALVIVDLWMGRRKVVKT